MLMCSIRLGVSWKIGDKFPIRYCIFIAKSYSLYFIFIIHGLITFPANSWGKHSKILIDAWWYYSASLAEGSSKKMTIFYCVPNANEKLQSLWMRIIIEMATRKSLMKIFSAFTSFSFFLAQLPWLPCISPWSLHLLLKNLSKMLALL